MLSKSIFLLFIVLSLKGYSQIDSSYIKPFSHRFSGKIYYTHKSSSILHKLILLEDPAIENTYEPNRPPGFGIGFSSPAIGFGISYGFDFLRDKNKGESKYIDLQYNHYGRKFIFDLFGTIYQGFYSDNELDSTRHYYSDLTTLRLGIFGQYILNSDKFSYRAAFKQSEEQIKSAGSFLIGGEIYFSSIFCTIPHFFNSSDSQDSIYSNFQFGPNFGYAYTWALPKRWFISLSITAGFNIGINSGNIGIDTGKNRLMLFPTTVPRFAAGYNADTWAISLTYFNNVIYTYFSEDRQIALNTGSLRLSFIKRFNVKNPKRFLLTKFI